MSAFGMLMAATVIVVGGFFASGLVAFGQTPEGDDLGPVPTIVDSDVAQSIVARVVFHSATEVELLSATVSHAAAPSRIGAPELIGIEMFDVNGSLLKKFNDWHPLWIEFENDDGELGGVSASSGEGRFVMPFAPDLGIVRITDIELGLVLIEIDARQIILAYCAASPSDPGCVSVPGPGQLPDTGGTSSDGGGFSSLLWIAAIAAAVALAGASAATWLARQRRRAR